MNYKEGDTVVLDVDGVLQLGEVVSEYGMSPFSLVVESTYDHWCYAFDENGRELDQSAKISPLTKLHKSLLGLE